MSATAEKVDERFLFAQGGVIDETGKKSERVLPYSYSHSIGNEYLPYFVKCLGRAARTAALLGMKDEKLGALAMGYVEDYYNVFMASNSIHKPDKPALIQIINTQYLKASVKGDEQAKGGIMQQLGAMFGKGGGNGRDVV